MGLMFVTDLHLDNYRPFSRILSNGMNSRLLDQLNVVKEVAAIIDREKPEAVLFLGDLFNGITESLPKIIYNAGFLTIQAWSNTTQLYVVVGNHDIYRGMHVLSTFESLPNVHVVSSTVQVQLAGHVIDLIPWGNPLPDTHGDVCAGHLEVYGAMMDAAYACKSGILPTAFTDYKHVLLGHFHNPQSIVIPGSNCKCSYIGAVMQTDRRTTSNGLLGVSLLEGNNLRLVHINSPRIYEYKINTNEDKEKFIEEVLDDKNYFRVIITSPEVDFPETLERVAIEYDLPALVTSRLNLPPESCNWASQLGPAVEAWIDQANTVLDKASLKKAAKELL